MGSLRAHVESSDRFCDYEEVHPLCVAYLTADMRVDPGNGSRDLIPRICILEHFGLGTYRFALRSVPTDPLSSWISLHKSWDIHSDLRSLAPEKKINDIYCKKMRLLFSHVCTKSHFFKPILKWIMI